MNKFGWSIFERAVARTLKRHFIRSERFVFTDIIPKMISSPELQLQGDGWRKHNRKWIVFNVTGLDRLTGPDGRDILTKEDVCTGVIEHPYLSCDGIDLAKKIRKHIQKIEKLSGKIVVATVRLRKFNFYLCFISVET